MFYDDCIDVWWYFIVKFGGLGGVIKAQTTVGPDAFYLMSPLECKHE